jgi:hypothetical protein
MKHLCGLMVLGFLNWACALMKVAGGGGRQRCYLEGWHEFLSNATTPDLMALYYLSPAPILRIFASNAWVLNLVQLHACGGYDYELLYKKDGSGH